MTSAGYGTLPLDAFEERGITLTNAGGLHDPSVAEHAFGMDVCGVKRDPDDYDGCLPADRVLASGAFRSVLPGTDLLVLAVPLTPATRGPVDRDALAALPDEAVLANAVRGPVVDEEALIPTLETGGLAGAGGDAFEGEPLPPDSPAWDREDVMVTPHVAGRSDAFVDRFAELFLDTVDRRTADEPLRNVVAGGD